MAAAELKHLLLQLMPAERTARSSLRRSLAYLIRSWKVNVKPLDNALTRRCGDNLMPSPRHLHQPYTNIGDHTTVRNTEIENTIIMEGTHIDCGMRNVDSLI